MLIYGINPVIEALRARRVRGVQVIEGDGPRLRELVSLATDAGVPVRRVSAEALDKMSEHGVHQGVAAELDQAVECTVEELVVDAPGPALVVVLDGIEDPHNLGAIFRTVDAVGATGVVVQQRRSAARGGAAAKASAGAVSHVRVAEVVNIARALEDLKAVGVWTVGLSEEAREPYDRIDLARPTAIVLGAEGRGLRRLVRERCDFLAAIPMRGHVSSLNVSVAAGVVLFEAIRQRAALYRGDPSPSLGLLRK
jgi:23S rRNA (guanosine2251-2'-O)-methyltransferase